METREQILRKYLKRKIAELNINFNSMSYKFRESAKTMRANIFTAFARGNNSTYDKTTSNIRLREIREEIQSTNNQQSPYNYFDLDTLIAYKEYLERVIDEIYSSRERNGRREFVIDDFTTAINYTAPRFLLVNAGKKETGYYDVKESIKVLSDNNGKMKYESTPEKRSFEKKYNYIECEKLLKEYLEEKHGEKIVLPDYDFILDKIKFVIESEENYRSEDDFPIKYIVARSIDNKTGLRGFFDMDMDIYHGDIYDEEGNWVYSKEDSGVIFYGRHHTKKFDGMGQ